MIDARRTRFGVGAGLLALGIAVAAFAQDAPPPADPAARETRPRETPPPKSLDELLGLDEEAPATGGDGSSAGEPVDPAAEVDVPDVFRAAIGLMDSVSGRLADRRDTGLGVQRDQEEIIRLLETLIDAAERQQMQMRRQQRSQGESGREQRERAPGAQSQGERRGEQSAPERGGAPTGETAEMEPPPPQAGVLREVLDESRAEWGALPERVRDLLLQGTGERFSSMYDRMTRAYYRRLAEEGSR